MAGKVSVQWKADTRLSAIHAAHVVATGTVCNDRKTEQAIAGPITEINNRLLSASLDVAKFWDSLVEESVTETNESKACEVALLQAGCSEMQLEQVTSVISNRLGESRMSFQRRLPKLAEQLELRGRPLRERWSTFGPGLLADIAKQIWQDNPPDGWWPSRVGGQLLQPMRGGDGDFDAESRRFWIEAVLTDVDPGVPEVLRVAYLVTQIAIEIHTRERSAENPGSLPWALGSVPIVLRAGQELELIKGDQLPVQSAVRLWQVGGVEIADQVSKWWSGVGENAPALPVALKQLSSDLEKLRDTKSDQDLRIDLTAFDQ